MLSRLAPPLLGLALILPACTSDNALVLADAAHDASAASASKQLLLDHAHALHEAAVALQAAAPVPSGFQDPASLASLRETWKQAHRAYAGMAGAVAMIFPDLDVALDARYEAALTAGPDPNLFDDEGFIGLHAIERILWASAAPARVIAIESALPGYVAPALPATMVEAAYFKYGLCGRLVADSEALEEGILALALDSPNAYEAGTRLIEDQLAKLKEAGEGLDESRYAGFSLADLRENLAAAQANHAIFREWLRGKDHGVHVDGEISGGFARLSQAFAAVSGDALPEAPAGWSSVDPTDAMRATPFGAIFLAVEGAADSEVDGSLAHSMDEAAGLLGISGATPPPTTAKPTHDSDDT